MKFWAMPEIVHAARDSAGLCDALRDKQEDGWTSPAAASPAAKNAAWRKLIAAISLHGLALYRRAGCSTLWSRRPPITRECDW